MSTETLQIPANLVMSAPRGARWAASAALALSRSCAPVYGWLQEIGQRRARRALLDLANSVEATQPSYAQDLRAAAGEIVVR